MNVRFAMAVRSLTGNIPRTLLVVLSIAVGVFAMGTIANSWVVLLNDLNTSYLATSPASAVLTVEPFDDGLVSAVEGRRDVSQAEGRTTLIVKLTLPDGQQANLSLEAVKDFNAIHISQFVPETGAWPPLRRQLLLERSYAKSLGLEDGTPVSIELPNGDNAELIVVGTVHDLHKVPAGNSEIAFGYVSMETLQWLGVDRSYNQLYLTVATDPLNKDHIQQVVTDVKDQTIKQSGYTVLTASIPTPGEAFLTIIINAVLIVLAVVGAFSLLLSGALVVNTVSAIVTQQIRQIGVMKAIGGVRIQIIQIYLTIALAYGLLSLIFAIPLAVAGTRGFTSYFAQIGNFDITSTGIPPGVILLEVVLGVLVPLIAALIPVGFGTRITVREAITSYGIGGDASQPTLIERILLKMRGVPSSLALSIRNTFRRKARLALTLGTLTLAGAIFIAVLSVRDSLFVSFDQALVYYGYDLSVDMGEAYRTRQLEREVNRVPGVVAVEGWLQTAATRIQPDGSESPNYIMIGVSPSSQFLEPELVAGRWVEPGDRNRIVVNTDFIREEPDIQVGDTITLKIGADDARWEVVGIATKQYSTPIIYVSDLDLGIQTSQVGMANRVLIRLADRTPVQQARAAQAIENRLKDAGLLVGSTTTRSDFVTTFEGRFNFLVIFLVMLAFMLALVGALGLAGTMGLNVLERVREIGVMRAIGASDGTVQRIIISEGVVIGAMSWALGSLLSLPLGKLMSDGVGVAFGGEPLAFSFSLLGLGMWLALAVGIAAISSYVPARRASRLTVREILSYE